MIFLTQYACPNGHRMAMGSFCEDAVPSAVALEVFRAAVEINTHKTICYVCNSPLSFSVAPESFSTNEEVIAFMTTIHEQALRNRRNAFLQRNRN